MKLRTNYTKQDWYKFIATWSICLSVMAVYLLFGMNYFLLPAIDMLSSVTNKMTENDGELAIKAGNFLRDQLGTKYSPEQILTSMMFAFMFSIVGGIVLFIQFMNWSLDVAYWGCKKLGLVPNMALVVIKNDRLWFRAKS